MSTELAALAITVIGAIGTVLNVWISMRMRADIAELKLWAMEKFVEKGDMRSTVQMYLSQERTRPRAAVAK